MVHDITSFWTHTFSSHRKVCFCAAQVDNFGIPITIVLLNSAFFAVVGVGYTGTTANHTTALMRVQGRTYESEITHFPSYFSHSRLVKHCFSKKITCSSRSRPTRWSPCWAPGTRDPRAGPAARRCRRSPAPPPYHTYPSHPQSDPGGEDNERLIKNTVARWPFLMPHIFKTRVADPWHFVTDPNQRIHASD